MGSINTTNENDNDQELKTYGVVNVNEIHKNPEDKKSEPENRLILKKWLTYSLALVFVLVIIGLWRKNFFYLSPLPPVIAYLAWKVKLLAEKVEKNNPL